MIRLDQSARSVVACCASCPTWRELRGDRAAALRAAAQHLATVHGDTEHAADRREQATRIDRRHAD